MSRSSGRSSAYGLVLLLLAVLVTAGCGGDGADTEDKMVLASGEIVFDEGEAPFEGATVYVRLEDVSRADAASTVVAEQTLRGIASSQGPVLFRLTGEPLDPQASYTVSAHVDVDGDGMVSAGDYLTMESYPVSAQSVGEELTVRVRRIQ
jgi:uncharacterized lipoprotein YbaY